MDSFLYFLDLKTDFKNLLSKGNIFNFSTQLIESLKKFLRNDWSTRHENTKLENSQTTNFFQKWLFHNT